MASSHNRATADPVPPRIGARLKSARAAKRLTLDELADSCGVTKGYLSKLERDHVNASVAMLIRVCAALEIPVGSLFESASVGEVVRADAYPRINFGGENMTEFLLTPSGERRFQVLLGAIEPGGGSGSESYELPIDVNFVFVVTGRLKVMFDGDPAEAISASAVVLGEGDSFTFSPRQRHCFRAEGAAPTKILWVLNPALPEGPRAQA
ncbi:XRE family transcriptional regulator [Rhodococcus sp. G-MC3]|uniref:helix-turn-helix domain-containing protein n=1 Tax=Rhodococcus sp. G-MC3 TaxID=3046209 RepID=UPI0024B9C3F1|nr:XRE family transcriptional regulator [Rhodococcus sp. G-MC3]MDJ0395827.1 XRE family transcriptional regulator [Rhodococcus sp. G-MC3]